MKTRLRKMIPWRNKSGNDTGSSYNPDKVPNTNGWVPFQRMMIVIPIVLIVSALLGIAVGNKWIYIDPPPGQNVFNFVDMSIWVLFSLVIPQLIVYMMSLLSSVYILTQSTGKYILWILKEARGKILTNYLIMQAVIVAVIIVSIMGQTEYAFIQEVEGSGMARVGYMMTIVAQLASLIPAWVGYSTAWSCYRKIGAQTMQDRYESHLRVMEIKNSGQMWDRIWKLHVPRIFGTDGNSPRFFVLWIVWSVVLHILLLSLGELFDVSAVTSIGLLGIATVITIIMAAIAKRSDGKIRYHRRQWLVPVRGPETEDTYDPSSTGVRQFARD